MRSDIFARARLLRLVTIQVLKVDSGNLNTKVNRRAWTLWKGYRLDSCLRRHVGVRKLNELFTAVDQCPRSYMNAMFEMCGRNGQVIRTVDEQAGEVPHSSATYVLRLIHPTNPISIVHACPQSHPSGWRISPVPCGSCVKAGKLTNLTRTCQALASCGRDELTGPVGHLQCIEAYITVLSSWRNNRIISKQTTSPDFVPSINSVSQS